MKLCTWKGYWVGSGLFLLMNFHRRKLIVPAMVKRVPKQMAIEIPAFLPTSDPFWLSIPTGQHKKTYALVFLVRLLCYSERALTSGMLFGGSEGIFP